MKLCLGTVQFGMDYGIQGAYRPAYNKVDDILDYAISHGITSLDTAAEYGLAEDVVGHFIKYHPKKTKRLKAVSKLAANTFNGKKKAEWKKIAVGHADRSRKALGVDKLEAYLFHNASMIYEPDAVRALNEVKCEGISKKIGVSIYTPQEALKALTYDEIEVIQIPYNLFDHRLDRNGFFIEARKRNIEVYARSTLLQGLLMMNENELPKNMQFAKAYVEKYHMICADFSICPLCAAINYVKQHAGIDFIIFGVDNLRQLREYIAMYDKDIPVEMISEFNKEFAFVEEKLVNPTLWN